MVFPTYGGQEGKSRSQSFLHSSASTENFLMSSRHAQVRATNTSFSAHPPKHRICGSDPFDRISQIPKRTGSTGAKNAHGFLLYGSSAIETQLPRVKPSRSPRNK